MKFAEEFDQSPLDYRKWLLHPPGKLILPGVQTFVSDAVTVSGGQAHLTAASGGNSGILTTFGTFAQTYGRFEIRLRAAAGEGVESTVELLPLSGDQPSVDVIDVAGGEPDRARFADRWNEGSVDRSYTGSYRTGNLADGFHTIAVEWDEEKIVWFVDGTERFSSYEGVPHQPMFPAIYLLLEKDARLPASLDIDYIRIFEHK